MLTLTERYEAACATPSDINEHLPTFVRLVEELDARLVIELGTRSGVSTIAWLYALQGRGELWSVDLDAAPDIGSWPHWHFVQGDDTDPVTFSALPGHADVVFIDSSHAYRHTLAELNLYHWLLRPGGKLVLHDTELCVPPELTERQPSYPVKRAINVWCAAEGLEWTNDERCFGLGIVTVP